MTRPLFITSAVAILSCALGLSSGGAAESRPYSLAASVRCLNHAEGKVTPVRRMDRRRIALSDLAQHGSREVRFGRRSVLLAFTRGTAEAALLREALVVPEDPYVLGVRSNVLLMYRPADVAAFRRAVRCLRVG